MTGLRLQIVAGLGVVALLLSGLLGLTLLKVASSSVETSLDSHIDTLQESAGRSLGSMLGAGASHGHLEDMARYWLETGSIDGIWVFDGSGAPVLTYARDDYRFVDVEPVLPTAAPARKIPASGAGASTSRFRQVPAGRGLGCIVLGTDMERLKRPVLAVRSLIALYLGLHVAMILAFGYILLTFLIVRPVEKLRHAAIRLGEGHFDLEVDTRSGAREIRELGTALERTARKLEVQRSALESKIVELEKAEAEIRAKQDAIVRSEKLASVGRLAAGVAHEIGNPLAVILGFLDLLRTADLPPQEQIEYVARMQGEAERMNRIVRGLLGYARPGTRERTILEIEPVLRDAVEMLRPQKIMRRVEVEIRPADGTPVVRAERDRLTQVFVNLVLNAAEAMVGEGRISIAIEPGQGGTDAVIRIEDDGPGIDPGILPILFEPFVTTKPEHAGTGLGLSVCQSIVQDIGGTITASSRESGGARFEVRIPAAGQET